MSYRTAIDQLVTAVQAISPGVLDTEHIGGGFSRDEKIGSADYVGGNRCFNFIGPGGFAGMQHNSRVTTDVDLLVDYVAPQGTNASDVDYTIHEDYAQLVKQLQDPQNWSDVCVIRPAGETRWPYSIEDAEGEDTRPVRRLTVSFSVEYTALD